MLEQQHSIITIGPFGNSHDLLPRGCQNVQMKMLPLLLSATSMHFNWHLDRRQHGEALPNCFKWAIMVEASCLFLMHVNIHSMCKSAFHTLLLRACCRDRNSSLQKEGFALTVALFVLKCCRKVLLYSHNLSVYHLALLLAQFVEKTQKNLSSVVPHKHP